ncbi:hypothetical protein EK0264_17835 [Epidermidibacterium keratini]|uniref:DUF7455 domain-containing protein n=1 Tax=Epidermidibacterium keratini TaxID=1891644 RepID=A0A7L4YSB3_9ACTN|nr:hypothetical protein [Epidermidibacterium keratini]QHC01952.1 hypothetical protein EK0264_17835 [Epidermidibacterium keratini]
MNATVPVAPDSTVELKATDRCDRCGARATTRATMASGLELLFCGHHAREYEAALKDQEFALS